MIPDGVYDNPQMRRREEYRNGQRVRSVSFHLIETTDPLILNAAFGLPFTQPVGIFPAPRDR